MARLSGIEPLNVMPVHWVDDEFGPGSDAMTAGSAPRLDRLLIGRPVDLLEIINCVVAAHAPGRHRVRSRDRLARLLDDLTHLSIVVVDR